MTNSDVSTDQKIKVLWENAHFMLSYNGKAKPNLLTRFVLHTNMMVTEEMKNVSVHHLVKGRLARQSIKVAFVHFTGFNCQQWSNK